MGGDGADESRPNKGAMNMMAFIPACGWCRHWGKGDGPLRLRHSFAGASYAGIVADGLVQMCTIASVPEGALPCVRVCATSPLDGMGCHEFSFYGR